MQYFLAKTDPETYSTDSLQKEGATVWSGVRNPTAVKALKQMKPGDKVLIYHSQGQGAIVGMAKVIGQGLPDINDERSWLVKFKFIKKFAEPYVTLKLIKATGKFEDIPLVRQGRLSTMPLTESFISWLKKQGLKL